MREEFHSDEIKNLMGMKKKQALYAVGMHIIGKIRPLTPWKTGTLRRATYFDIITESYLQFINNEKYAVWVEKGTSKMPPRSFMKAGIEDNRGDIERILKQELHL